MFRCFQTFVLRAVTVAAVLSTMALSCSFSYPFSSYTITDDNETLLAPEAVRHTAVLTGQDLGVGPLDSPMCIRSDLERLYIADTGNDRVIIAGKDGTSALTIQTFERQGGGKDSLKEPQGLFVTNGGELYVADTGNNRVLVFDTKGSFIREMPAPESDSLPDGFVYLPKALALDKAGRMYVVAQNVNSGLMEFDENGAFRGYMGANRVRVDFLKVLLRRFSTDEQLKRMIQTVPTEYNSIAVDAEGFLYVTTDTLSDEDITASINSRSSDERNAPIRKLNASGVDVLQRAGSFPPVGDTAYDYYAVHYSQPSGPSKLVDITVDDSFCYAVLDEKRGHVFKYDSRGNLLYEFGGLSETSAGFRAPVSLAQIGDTYYILDSSRNCVVQYEETVYGARISQATADYAAGRYDDARLGWEQVLQLNSNCEIAYTGLGLVKYREKDYKSAMEYFLRGRNRTDYSKAYKKYRTQMLSENFGWIAGVGGGIVVIILAVVIARKGRSFWKRVLIFYLEREKARSRNLNR